MKEILIIEDDSLVPVTLKSLLEKKGFQVKQIFNGSVALRTVINTFPDLIILDICLPDVSGYEVCKQLREFYQRPIIFITSDGNSDVEIKCFEVGGDDFVLKSAPFEVLFQRIKRLGVRPMKYQSVDTLSFGELKFIPASTDCFYKTKALGLTQEEYELFYFIATRHESAVSRQVILKVLKGSDYDGVDRSIDIKIARIRNKLKLAGLSENIILSVRSKGYQFCYVNIGETTTAK
ncbi:response regulator transcription factor [Colwellia sp. Arc7-635]|uniref:response regulator transcription factor n=1 Tax=Colwellia sp. Arc7-635 TaxID=2497879 RepID=UPI000F85A401|nr:response regulator transcription factor [Colwellia sp. Arc7-635]AZQ82623.1 response regulator transcription factor [Colwellia sp. Arc7-635]